MYRSEPLRRLTIPVPEREKGSLQRVERALGIQLLGAQKGEHKLVGGVKQFRGCVDEEDRHPHNELKGR